MTSSRMTSSLEPAESGKRPGRAFESAQAQGRYEGGALDAGHQPCQAFAPGLSFEERAERLMKPPVLSLRIEWVPERCQVPPAVEPEPEPVPELPAEPDPPAPA